jgi:hypothetical protein
MRHPTSLADNPSGPTLDYYNSRAEQFWLGTRDHDVGQNIDALLAHIAGEAPFTILDLGCGPGRDLKAFAQRGHTPIGLDGAEEFVRMAEAHSGCPVWHQNFLDKPAGILFSSNPHGPDRQGFSGGRFGAYHSPERWAELVSSAGFTEILRYFRPAGLPRDQQPWLATLWRRS